MSGGQQPADGRMPNGQTQALPSISSLTSGLPQGDRSPLNAQPYSNATAHAHDSGNWSMPPSKRKFRNSFLFEGGLASILTVYIPTTYTIARDRDFFFFACLLLMEYNLCLPLLSLAPAARDRRMISQITRALLLNFYCRFFSRFIKSGPTYSDHPQCRRITYSPVGTRDACISKSPLPGKPLFCAVLQTSQKMLT